MKPQSLEEREAYIPAGKLRGKVALIHGTDSGIGKDVAILYARKGADISAVYSNEHEDARETERRVKEDKRRCHLIRRDRDNPPRLRLLIYAWLRGALLT